MIISCTSCGTKYKYDDAKLEGVISKKVRCTKCKTVIEVFNPVTQTSSKSGAINPDRDPMEETHPAVPEHAPNLASMTAGAATKTALVTQPMTEEDISPRPTEQVVRESALTDTSPEGEDLGILPEYRRFSIAVIQGFNAGDIYPINKTKTVVGRADSDIIVKDLEASRQHARIDVMGDRVVLRDLSSTNGTFVNEQRIDSLNLENQQEFRIGTTVFMLIITELE